MPLRKKRQEHPADIIAGVRAEYDGGRGPALTALAMKHGIPVGTLHCRSAKEGWRTAPRPGETRLTKRSALTLAKKFIELYPGHDPQEIREMVVAEIGDGPMVPERARISMLMPWHRPKVESNTGIQPAYPIHGLRRRCQADGCGAITTSDPCGVCGTATGTTPPTEVY